MNSSRHWPLKNEKSTNQLDWWTCKMDSLLKRPSLMDINLYYTYEIEKNNPLYNMKYLMFVFLVLFISFLLFIEPITYFFWSVILLGASYPLEVVVVCSLISFVLAMMIGRPKNESPKNPYRDWDTTLAVYKVLPFFWDHSLLYKVSILGHPPHTNSLSLSVSSVVGFLF